VPPEIVLAVQIAAVTAVSLGVFAWVERPARTYLRRRRSPLPAPVAAAA
jgi:peptidoglycan/LPS O-acetylase OafA/YrhL